MKESTVSINGRSIREYSCNTVVVGSGAAGFNAADRLCQFGQRDIALVTEGMKAGTSRNTGSDKQTYYKLTLSGGEPDSVGEMAKTLFEGQCMDGDLALCEAALSARAFLRLVDLGVEFPTNRYGEFIGYKTDHDPRRRATSVGPLTSKRMTECLETAVKEREIPIFDGYQVISILSEGGEARGLLCLDLKEAENEEKRFVVFRCKNVVYATGGPAGIYADSVFPHGHLGASGLAFEAGAKGRNLTEWQYGLASVRPRWNVSGTYMQVLPRFVSTDENGGDEREFLPDYFDDKGDLLTKVFLKGYQWPFDVRKAMEGSSIVDILVYIERNLKGRRVFLDFRSNPFGLGELDYGSLSPEARDYLEKAGACFGTPLDRLLLMNTPAVDFYKNKGVDLSTEMLEIALCAQHNNGGIAVDCWWQTDVSGLFAAGEAAGTHGVYRPGGSALNSGQVGSTRAAQYIAARCQGDAPPLGKASQDKIAAMIALGEKAVSGQDTVEALTVDAQREMSRVGAAIRDKAAIRDYAGKTAEQLQSFGDIAKVESPKALKKFYRLYDILLCQKVYLEAMGDYVGKGGGSRGSALYTDPDGGKPMEELPEIFRFLLEDGSMGAQLQEAAWKDGAVGFSWRPVHPIPEEDDFFENVWRRYREDGNIY
ncbi:MAG: FAD-binding protein [Oscillospiraceae bacterium]